MVQIPIKEIHIGQNMRSLTNDTIDELTKSIREIGLLHAITVEEVDGTPKYILRAGNHRLHACINLGWDMIEANVRRVVGDDHREELRMRLITIDENLIRTEWSIDRDDMLMEKQEIWEELYPETKKTATLKQNQKTTTETENLRNGEDVKTFTENTAKLTGESQSNIQKAIYRAKNLTPESKQAVKTHNLTQANASDLAHKPPEIQAEYVKQLNEGVNPFIAEKKVQNDEYAVKRAEELKKDPVRQEKVEKTITESLGVRSVAEIGEE